MMAFSIGGQADVQQPDMPATGGSSGGADGQQNERVPEQMPDTCAGGIAGGGLPLGGLAATGTLLAAGAFGALRRRRG